MRLTALGIGNWELGKLYSGVLCTLKIMQLSNFSHTLLVIYHKVLFFNA